MGRCGECKTEGWSKSDAFPPCDDSFCAFPYYEDIPMSESIDSLQVQVAGLKLIIKDIAEAGRLPIGRTRSKYIVIPASLFTLCQQIAKGET